MTKSQTLCSLLLASSTLAAASLAPVRRDGSSPGLRTDPNSSKYCTWWIDYSSTQACSELLSDNAITLTDFRRWNPAINEKCDNLAVGYSYCVEAFNEPPPSTTTTSSKVTTSSTTIKTTSTMTSSTTLKTTTTSTKTSNGISTPTPTQPGMVDNCNKFHFVVKDENCQTISAKYGISQAQFQTWNPNTGSTCSGLWSDTYACVGIIGSTPTTTVVTSTKSSNGVTTPTPTQSGMVSNCNRFHWVVKDETCQTISAKYGISTSQFITWNPAAKSDCTGLWTETYACVGLIGMATSSVTPTKTKTPNGISTPTPSQPGMVDNCDSFYYVKTDETCAGIAKKYGISLSQFTSWNTNVGNDCKGLYANTYACVSIVGHEPPTTTKTNGVATPTPTRDNMTKNCKSFYKVVANDTCEKIANKYGITSAKFIEWNPDVGSQCKTLWPDYYACVAVL